MKSLSVKALYFILSFTLLYSCQKEKASEVNSSGDAADLIKKPDDPGFATNDMVLYWNEKTSTVLGASMNQPRRSRLFAITQIAVHDVLNCIKPKYQRFALVNAREQFANPNAAVASAAYWTIKGLNIQGSFPVDSWYNESLATIPDGDSKELGKTLGKQSAEAIISNRANDGLSEVLTTSMLPAEGNDPGEYKITLFWSNPALNLPLVKHIPNWGTMLRPFVVASNDQFRPAGPHPVNSTAYTQDYNEVKSKGARFGHTRTTEESTIAFFWSDARPSLIWNTLVRNVIASKKMDAWKTARLFALVHTAIGDGINSVMEAKYHFYNWRPETAIRLGDADGNPNTAGDASWLPSITEIPNANILMTIYTPPVPEYPSSFAMYGGVVAEVLRSFFGTDNISFDLTSLALPNVVRHYNSFSEVASENNVSKIYGGFYFRKAVLDGEAQGRDIGNYVFNHHFREMDN